MKLFEWVKPKNWGIFQVYRDIENYIDWMRIIRGEENSPDSKFSKFDLKRTRFFDVYTIVTLDESDSPLPEMVKRTKVIESLNPINRYLDEDLGFAECLSVEFNQFEDDNKKLTLSYLIMYRLIFKRLSLAWIFRNTLFVLLVIFFISKFHIIWPWLSSLIEKM